MINGPAFLLFDEESEDVGGAETHVNANRNTLGFRPRTTFYHPCGEGKYDVRRDRSARLFMSSAPAKVLTMLAI